MIFFIYRENKLVMLTLGWWTMPHCFTLVVCKNHSGVRYHDRLRWQSSSTVHQSEIPPEQNIQQVVYQQPYKCIDPANSLLITMTICYMGATINIWSTYLFTDSLDISLIITRFTELKVSSTVQKIMITSIQTSSYWPHKVMNFYMTVRLILQIRLTLISRMSHTHSVHTGTATSLYKKQCLI